MIAHVVNRDDVERFAHCWNCHDELVAALSHCRDYIATQAETGLLSTAQKKQLEEINQALAKAKGA